MLARHTERLRRRDFAAERALDRERVAAIGRVVANAAYTADAVRRAYGRAADAVVPPVIPDAAPGARAPASTARGCGCSRTRASST
jgi:hypothetical protein